MSGLGRIQSFRSNTGTISGTTFIITGFTEGSVLFIGPGSVVSENNSNFFINNTDTSNPYFGFGTNTVTGTALITFRGHTGAIGATGQIAIDSIGGGGGASTTSATAASGGGYSLVGGVGGVNSDTGNSGVGGGVLIQAGTGGAKATGTGNAGNGGTTNVRSGNGGANTNTVGSPGSGGSMTVAGGSGGASSNTTAGGTGGSFTMSGGTGGSNSSTGAGGAGGGLTFVGGAGSAKALVSGNSGGGAAISFRGGAGGANSNSSSGNAGAGGTASVLGGQAGALTRDGGTGSLGGIVSITGGQGSQLTSTSGGISGAGGSVQINGGPPGAIVTAGSLGAYGQVRINTVNTSADLVINNFTGYLKATSGLVSAVTPIPGSDVGGFTDGSVIFASGGGVLSEDNAKFFYNNAGQQLYVGTNTGDVRMVISDDGTSDLGLRIENTNASDRDANARLILRVADNGRAQSFILFDDVLGDTKWVIGFSKTDNIFKINTSVDEPDDDVGILEIATDKTVVWNEAGLAVDFRIEGSSTEPNLFFVDGSANAIGIGTDTPTENLHVFRAVNSDVTVLVDNTSNTAGVEARYIARVGGTSAADPYISFVITSGATWSIGADNSSSDALKFVGGSSPSTQESYFQISTTGVVTVNEGATSSGDFIVKGDNDSVLIFSDASVDAVGFGQSTPTAKVHILGTTGATSTVGQNGLVAVAGTGGASANASGAGTGGSHTITAATGGVNSSTGVSGNGGNVTLSSGNGAAKSATSGNSGSAGTLSLGAGSGGNNGNSTSGTSGVGGTVQIFGGQGGAMLRTSGTAAVGGPVNISGGVGGTALGTSTTAGAGANVNIAGGEGGEVDGGTTGADGGNVVINGGSGTNGVNGHTFIGANTGFLAVGLGTGTDPDVMTVISNTSTTNLGLRVQNIGNSAGTQDARVHIRSGGTSGGDAFVRWEVASTTNYSLGIDNSNSDSLSLQIGSDLTGTRWVDFTTGGAIVINNDPSGSFTGVAHSLDYTGGSFGVGVTAYSVDGNSNANAAPITGFAATITATGGSGASGNAINGTIDGSANGNAIAGSCSGGSMSSGAGVFGSATRSVTETGYPGGKWGVIGDGGSLLYNGTDEARIVRIAGGGTTAMRQDYYAGTVTTTTNAVTTIFTFATASNTVYTMVGEAVARRTGGSAGAANDMASYSFQVAIKNNAGTVTTPTATTTTIYEDQAGWNFTFAISGTSVLAQVTGATNNNITWHAIFRIMECTS